MSFFRSSKLRTLAIISAVAGGVGANTGVSQAEGISQTDVPPFAIVYKIAPESVPDQTFLKKLRRLISEEQFAYQEIARAGPRNLRTPYNDKTFLFSQEQIGDRHPNFVSDDLLPEYKSLLQWQATAIPRRLQFVKFISTRRFRYENGEINANTPSGQGPDVFYRLPVQDGNTTQRYQTLGERALLREALPLQARVDASFFDKLPTMPMPRVALNRLPTLAPIAMERTAAEATFSPPENCRSSQAPFGRVSRTATSREQREAAQARHSACSEKTRRFKMGFEIRFDVSIEGMIEDAKILTLRLNKVEVFSPHGEPLKTYLPNDLETPKDAAAERRAASRAAEREAEHQQEEDRAAISLRQAEIEKADILGVNLSMPVDEAEAIVRSHMAVERIRQSSSEGIANPFFKDIRQLENADGSDRVVLFRAGPQSDVLVGVGRVRKLPNKAAWGDVGELIVQKFGEPTEGADHTGYSWFAFDDRRICRTNVIPARAPAVIEGEAPRFERFGSISVVKPGPAFRGKTQNDAYTEIKNKCSAYIFARVTNSTLYMAIIDAGKFAAGKLTQEQQKQEQPTIGHKLKL